MLALAQSLFLGGEGLDGLSMLAKT